MNSWWFYFMVELYLFSWLNCRICGQRIRIRSMSMWAWVGGCARWCLGCAFGISRKTNGGCYVIRLFWPKHVGPLKWADAPSAAQLSVITLSLCPQSHFWVMEACCWRGLACFRPPPAKSLSFLKAASAASTRTAMSGTIASQKATNNYFFFFLLISLG